MKVYIVTNGNYISGYFLSKENAEKEKEKVNKLTDDFRHLPNVDKVYCWVDIVETED